ncbi:MAG TPA: PAS domain S-box protein, partial [Prosthecobacter sp.]|nr:PAS domain S-box protein [Prosthecobacter sp.]
DAGMRLLRATFVEQVLGRSFAELVHPDFQESVRQRVDWLVEAPRIAPVVELKLIAIDGAVVDVEVRAVSFPSASNAAIQVTCRDITERTRAQAALQASEQRLRQTLDALPMAAYTCDANGLITYYNEKALEMWGRTPRLNSPADRFCGSFQQLHLDGRPVAHEESWTAMTLAQKRAFGGGEVIMVRPDGGRRYVTAHTNPFFDGDGSLVGAVNVLMDVTERRLAQAALQESEERFRIVAKAATDAIWDWDIVSDTIWWSEGIQTLFGYPAEEMPPDCHTWTARIHPDDQKRIIESIFMTMENGGQHWEDEYHFERSDGSYAYVLDRGFVIRDAAGKAVRMIGGMTDLSDRRRIEKNLQESEAKFRELAENIDAVFYNRDVANNRLLYISPAYERIWGRSCQSAYGNADSYFEAVYPRDSDLVWEAQERLAAGEETDIEYRIVTGGGELKWIRDHSYPVCNAHGQVERIVGTARDVTERKLVDQRIVEQAELLDKAHDAILVHDLDLRITYWNKSAERLYGWKADEMLGNSVASLLDANAPDFVQASRTLQENGEWSGELQQTNKDGGEITVEARWTLVRDNYGQPQAVFAIHTDITERKRMEAQFLRVQRMESLGTLAGGIAHDLNNVLAPIMMSIDLLKLSRRDGNDQSILSTIEQSAKRGAEMVQQVLSFARGVEGRRLMIDPADVVREVQHMVHETFPKNIDFHARLIPDLPAIIGDPTQVHQVLINLCVNARDAMPNGGRLELSAETVTVDAHYVALNPNARPGTYLVLKV